MLLFAHDCECVEDHGADTQNSCVSAFLNRVKKCGQAGVLLVRKNDGSECGVGNIGNRLLHTCSV